MTARMPRLGPPVALASFLAASGASAQINGDPAGSSPMLGALDWVRDTLLGNLATAAAVIAVAVVGFLMLAGRIEWRRGLTVIVGCFIIFGATAIVEGIRSVASGFR